MDTLPLLELVRRGGKYNMILEFVDACQEAKQIALKYNLQFASPTDLSQYNDLWKSYVAAYNNNNHMNDMNDIISTWTWIDKSKL